MRFIKYLSILFVCTFCFSSCEQEDDGQYHIRGVSFYLAEEVTTRSNEVTSFADGDAVGVYVLDKSAGNTLKGSGNFADNKKFVWDAAKKSFYAVDNDNLIFNSPDHDLTFFVYYPYSSEVTDATALNHSIKGITKDDDFLYAVNGSTDGKQAVSLSFNHLLSKVIVKYTSEENRNQACMSVSSYQKMNINLATGAVSTITDSRTDMELEKVVETDYAGFIGVIAPQTYRQGEKFGTLSYTGGGSYPFSFAEDRTFASGDENEVFFMPKQPAYVFSATPAELSVDALDNAVHPFSVTSTKSQAINGTTLPGTTIDIGYSMTAKPDWITISGRDIAVAENRISSPRSGTVSWTQEESGYKTAITINQDAALINEVYNFTFSDGNAAASWSDVAASGGAKTYIITSNKQTFVNGNLDQTEEVTYSSSRDASWITVSGSAITVAENRTTSIRSGAVTFIQSSTGKTIRVAITQSAGTSTDNYIFTFSDGGASISWNDVAAVGATNTYSIISNKEVYINGTLERTTAIGYSSSSNVSWISVSAANVNVAENRTTSARSGVVTFAQSESGKTISVNIRQSAGNTTTEYSGWSTTSLSLSASPNPVASTGGSSTLSCKANQTREKYIKWNGLVTSTETETQTVSVTASWSKVSGSGSLSGSIVTFGNNTSSGVVSGVYRASYGGKTADITVSQSAGNTTTEYSGWSTTSLSLSASPNPVASTGGSSTLSCKANQTREKYIKWNGVTMSTSTEEQTISVTASWSKVSGSGSLSGSTVTFGNNTSSGVVSGVYRASYGGKTADITVSQSAGNTTTEYSSWSTVSLSPSASPNPVASTGGTSALSCKARQTREKYIKWNGVTMSTSTEEQTISVTASWSKVSGSGSLSGSTVTFGNNASSGVVSGVYRASYGGKTADITVSQSAGNTTTEYSSWSTTSLSPSASPNPVASTGGTSALSCKARQTREKYIKWNGVTMSTSTEEQTISVTASWSKVSGSGSLSGSTVTFGNNTSSGVVSGVYRASYGGKTADITVSQSAGNTTTEYSSWSTVSLSPSASPNPVASTGGTSALSCKARQTREKYIKWNGVTMSTSTEEQTISVTASWSKVSGSGSLSGSTVTFGNNTSSGVVSGVYRASYGGKTADITVSQSAGTITYTYNFTLGDGSTSTSWTSISASGASKEFSVISTRLTYVNGVHTSTDNVTYSSSSTVGWASASGSTITVVDNPNATPRGGVMTFTQSASGNTIQVTMLQLKKSSVDID